MLFAISGGDDMSMMEIQEAAQVITESIDPEAKVIFGAIHDDRLKKGQIKITVIASGFGGTQAPPKKKGLFAQEIKPEAQTTPTFNQNQTPANDLGVLMQRNQVKKDGLDQSPRLCVEGSQS